MTVQHTRLLSSLNCWLIKCGSRSDYSLEAVGLCLHANHFISQVFYIGNLTYILNTELRCQFSFFNLEISHSSYISNFKLLSLSHGYQPLLILHPAQAVNIQYSIYIYHTYQLTFKIIIASIEQVIPYRSIMIYLCKGSDIINHQ